MGATVTFSYPNWIAAFPELSSVSQAAASNYFGMATLLIRNDGGGPINDPNMQQTLLNLATAHLARLLSQQTDGVPVTGGNSGPNNAVGRPSSATEGSVTVQLDFPDQQPNAAWWNQTQYGAVVWIMMRPFRTFRYLGPTNRRTFNPPSRYRGWMI